MIKYELNPRLRYDMFNRTSPTWWITNWKHQVEFIRLIEAEHYNIFSIMTQLEHFCCYYSKKELQFVPVGGWLIPAKYFEVEIV